MYMYMLVKISMWHDNWRHKIWKKKLKNKGRFLQTFPFFTHKEKLKFFLFNFSWIMHRFLSISSKSTSLKYNNLLHILFASPISFVTQSVESYFHYFNQNSPYFGLNFCLNWFFSSEYFSNCVILREFERNEDGFFRLKDFEAFSLSSTTSTPTYFGQCCLTPPLPSNDDSYLLYSNSTPLR